MVFYSLKEFRNISTGLLFIFMAISNLFHLWTLATEFLTIYNIILYRHVVFQCQLTYWIQNISRGMSTYLMVTVTIDRLIRTELPMRSKTICTKRNIIFITCFYLIIFSIFWSFYLYPYATQNPISGSCSYGRGTSFSYFLTYIHVPIRAVLVCFIPAIIMLVANIRMIMNVRLSKRRITNVTIIASTEINLPQHNSLNNRQKKKPLMSKIDRMFFYMMLANVIIFFITQIPYHIYSCIRPNLTSLRGFTSSLIRALLLMWSSLYFGIAFYFYCLTSPLFRHKFMKIIRKSFCCQTISSSRIGQTVTFG